MLLISVLLSCKLQDPIETFIHHSLEAFRSNKKDAFLYLPTPVTFARNFWRRVRPHRQNNSIHRDRSFRVVDHCVAQMWSGVPVGQFQVHVKVNRSQDGHGCQAVQDFVHARRYIDLFVATVGLIFAALHFTLLLYLRYSLKRRGFFLLFVQVRMD